MQIGNWTHKASYNIEYDYNGLIAKEEAFYLY